MDPLQGTIVTCEAWNMSYWHVSQRAPCNGGLKLGCPPVCTIACGHISPASGWGALQPHLNSVLGRESSNIWQSLGTVQTNREPTSILIWIWEGSSSAPEGFLGSGPCLASIWPPVMAEFDCPSGCGREMLKQTSKTITEQTTFLCMLLLSHILSSLFLTSNKKYFFLKKYSAAQVGFVLIGCSDASDVFWRHCWIGGGCFQQNSDPGFESSYISKSSDPVLF